MTLTNFFVVAHNKIYENKHSLNEVNRISHKVNFLFIDSLILMRLCMKVQILKKQSFHNIKYDLKITNIS